jgi:hypothetical protein
MVKFYDPIEDGTQVLRHTGYDLRMLDEAAQEITPVQSLLDEPGTLPALTRDVFFSLHRAVPDGEPLAPVRPSHLGNQRAIQEMMSTEQWTELRQ